MGFLAVGFWILVVYFFALVGILSPEVMQESVVPFIQWGLWIVGGFASWDQIEKWHKKFKGKLFSREHAKYRELQPQPMQGFTEWRRKQRSGWQTFWYWAFFIN